MEQLAIIESPDKQARNSLVVPTSSRRKAPEYLDLIALTSNRRESVKEYELEMMG